MALNDDELLAAYDGLMKAYPEDVHIARYLVHLLQEKGRVKDASEQAMIMARRMLSLGYSSYAVAFLTICERLGMADQDEVESMKMIAELTRCSSGHGEGKVFELIEGLSDSESNTFLREGFLREVKSGQMIVRQGEVSRTFYIILDGELSVDLETKPGMSVNLRILEKGEFFGEFACLYRLPRMASVSTVSDATLLEFPDSAVDELIDHSPLAGESLMKVVQRRMIESVSLSHQAFSELAYTDRNWMATVSQVMEYMPKEEFDDDDFSGDRFFYIIIHGKAVATRELKDGTVLSCELEARSMFGAQEHELGLPEGTVLHVPERCLVCKVPIEIFNTFSNAYRGFEYWVRQHVAQRNAKLYP